MSTEVTTEKEQAQGNLNVKFVVGGSGTGKTTMLVNRIKEEKDSEVEFIVLTPLEEHGAVFEEITANKVITLPIYQSADDYVNNKVDYTYVEEFERIFLDAYTKNKQAITENTPLTKKVFMLDGYIPEMTENIAVEELLKTILTVSKVVKIETWVTTQSNAKGTHQLPEEFLDTCEVIVLDKK